MNTPHSGNGGNGKPRSAFDEHLHMVRAGTHPLAGFDTGDYIALLRAITEPLDPDQPVFCCLSRRGRRSPHPPPPGGKPRRRKQARCPFCHPEDYLRQHN